MPIYVYECKKCGEFEVEQRITDEPLKQCSCGRKVTKIITRCSFYVPPWMRAPGAKGSSADSCDRQAVYLQSDDHRKNREQAERIQRRQEEAANSKDRFFKEELGDPVKVKEKVEKRRYERKQLGLPV